MTPENFAHGVARADMVGGMARQAGLLSRRDEAAAPALPVSPNFA